MTLLPGSPAPGFEHRGIDGQVFHSRSLAGKRTLVTFFRFATCPFCNLHMNQLIQRSRRWGSDVQVVAFFETPLETLRKHQSDREAGFPILSDAQRTSYRAYGVRRSFPGMALGMITRFPSLVRSLLQGNIPREFGASMLTMPASFLIDEQGTVVQAYYGKDEGDHIPWEVVEAFFAPNTGIQAPYTSRRAA